MMLLLLLLLRLLCLGDGEVQRCRLVFVTKVDLNPDLFQWNAARLGQRPEVRRVSQAAVGLLPWRRGGRAVMCMRCSAWLGARGVAITLYDQSVDWCFNVGLGQVQVGQDEDSATKTVQVGEHNRLRCANYCCNPHRWCCLRMAARTSARLYVPW